MSELTRWQRIRLSPQVAIDETVNAVLRRLPDKPPAEAAPDRLAVEMSTAAILFEEQGWLAAPETYHRTPPPLTEADMVGWRNRKGMWRHESVEFESGFRPRAIEPGAARWPAGGGNDIVPARILRKDPAAPWVVCLHGFGMGSSRSDLSSMAATFLHHKLGFNVAVPVAPLHGTRRTKGEGQLLSLDLSSVLHGVTQALWDVRRLISWIRSTSDAPVGIYGVSLGGYLTTLLTGLEPVDTATAAIPFIDVLGLLQSHAPPAEYREVVASAEAAAVFRVVSPLALPTVVAPTRRAMLAARVDRLIPHDQSVALGEAWHEGHVQWLNTGHVGYTWSRAGKQALAERMREALLVGQN